MLDPKSIRSGDRVQVRHDNGELRWHEVKYGTWQLGHGEWVIGLEDIPGCYAFDRVVQHEPDMPVFVGIGKMLSEMGVSFAHGPLCMCIDCMPAERTVIVEDISGVVVAVPVSEVPEF